MMVQTRRRRPHSGRSPALLGVAVGLCWSCSSAVPTSDPTQEPAASRPSTPSEAAPEPGPPPPARRRIAKVSLAEHPAKVAWVFDGDPRKPTKMEITAAEEAGYTVIDLSNGWVPYIFTDKTVGAEDLAANDYRARYVGLANDKIDADGEPLRPHEHNHLELYGIPPSLGVIHEEWKSVDGEVQSCLDAAGFDPSVFQRFTGVIAYESEKKGKNKIRKASWLKKDLEKKLKKAHLDPQNLDAAAEDPRFSGAYKGWRELQDEIDIIDHAQRRFRCEKLFVSGEGKGKYEPGVFDSPTTHALAAFEKKHAIMGWGHFTKENVAALAQTMEQSTHMRLLRALEERTTSGAGILEDGSAGRWKKDFTWKDKSGAEQPLRDLVGESTDAVLAALGVGEAAAARAQLDLLSDLQPGGFDDLLIAVRLPPLPEYYQDDMDFEVVIDRGDVWYDFLYDESGKRLSQPRERKPRFTLYTNYEGQKIPLVRWPTTIGSWRLEMNDGEEMYKYKNSDVGERVWKEIVAGPTWIPPASTPPRELLKRRWKDGAVRTLVNYDEMGPGYASAYGLVAAYHIREVKDENGNVTADIDNQIRTHGSVDYMSILRRYSHGCHRLYNMSAVRLFSFILQHRGFEREGQTKLGFSRDFEWEEKSYNISLKTRGYRYKLARPIPVDVTKGRIQGKRKNPIEGYVAKPKRPGEGEDAGDAGSDE
ncbi:MAG TPA: hypothetical protein PKW35_13285 [Nannocystaceae bacterium]|nr:hypothetical protein [Nannocystaceae bacterium]